jgi:hypothetical protein
MRNKGWKKMLEVCLVVTIEKRKEELPVSIFTAKTTVRTGPACLPDAYIHMYE